MAFTRRSSALRIAVPPTGKARTSSALASATASRSPSASVWAAATAVTTPMSGRATSHSRAICPVPLVPISITADSTSSSALASVSGTPSSLLNDFSLAVVRNLEESAAAARSLVDVLPTEPVIPTTVAARRSRPARPKASNAAAVSATATRGTLISGRGAVRIPGLVDEHRSRPGRHGGVDPLVTVPNGAQRHEERPRRQQPRVDPHPAEDFLGRDRFRGAGRESQGAAGGEGHSRGGPAHRARSCQTGRPPSYGSRREPLASGR